MFDLNSSDEESSTDDGLPSPMAETVSAPPAMLPPPPPAAMPPPPPDLPPQLPSLPPHEESPMAEDEFAVQPSQSRAPHMTRARGVACMQCRDTGDQDSLLTCAGGFVIHASAVPTSSVSTLEGDECGNVCHLRCHQPTPLAAKPLVKWYCAACRTRPQWGQWVVDREQKPLTVGTRIEAQFEASLFPSFRCSWYPGILRYHQREWRGWPLQRAIR